MTRHPFCALALLLAAAVCFSSLITAFPAEAARVGGGKSFGGSSSYSRPAPSPAPRAAQPAQPGSQAYSQQQAPRPASPMGAPRSGFGGMMGGLLAGSLLGALFFGGPYSGFGFSDMILFAVVAFMGLKLFQLFRRQQPPTAAPAAGDTKGRAPDTPRAAGGGATAPGADVSHHSAQPDPWQRMRSNAPADAGRPGGFEVAPAGRDERRGADVPVPPGFDQADFLRGAKMAFARLQESWDKRDLDDIARFSTAAIMNEVREQAKADPHPSRTDILLVNASLVAVDRQSQNDVASVFFDVLLREDPKAEAPNQVREIWHFVRPTGSNESWKLDGIQQVEN